MYDIAIIGSGPAGYSAGIYASRALLSTVIFSGPQPGGQLTTTTVVENYAGFSDGIGGMELLEAMKKQAERFGVSMQSSTVTGIVPKKTGGPFTLITDSGEYEAKTIILATGAQAKKLGIETEDRFSGKGVSYCATCDGFFFRGKNVAVVGGGDTAMEEATFLSAIASSVTIIHRSDKFRASPVMLEKARKNGKIRFLVDSAIESFSGSSVLEAVVIRNTKTGAHTTVPFSGVFVAIGHIPATQFVDGLVARDSEGYIQIQAHDSRSAGTQTSVLGIFAAGDCADPRYRQGIVAAGSGAMAAIDAQRYLESA